jgi:hypothetical protein
LANASSPRIANSASGPACTPEEVVTAILSSSPGSASSSAAAYDLAGAGVAGLDPLEPRRAADEVDQLLAELPGIPNTTSARSTASCQRSSSSGTPPSPLMSPTHFRVGSSSGR